MRITTRTLGVGLIALVLVVSGGFAGTGAIAVGDTTTTNQTTTTGSETTAANRTTTTSNETTVANRTTAAKETTVGETTTAVNETIAGNRTTTAVNETTVSKTTTTTNQTTVGRTTATTTTTQAADNAQVRFAHMSPDAPPVDVLVDGETAVSNLSYGNVTDYASVPAGEHNVSITAANDPSTVVFSGNVTFSADTNYTVAATGLVSGSGENAFEPVVYEDNFTAPEQGNASVRLVHVALGAGPVDVTVKETGATLFDNVSFRDASAYEEVPAGNYTLEVRRATADDSGTVLKTFDVSLNESTVYSAFAAGYADPNLVPQGSPERPFDLILVTDFVAAGNATTAAPATTTAEGTTAPPQTTTAPQPTASTTSTAPPKATSVNTTTPGQTTSANRTSATTGTNETVATGTGTTVTTNTSTAERANTTTGNRTESSSTGK